MIRQDSRRTLRPDRNYGDCGFRWKHSRIDAMTNRSRSDGWTLIEGQYGARSAYLAGNAIAAEMFSGAFLTARFYCAWGLSHEFAIPSTLANS